MHAAELLARPIVHAEFACHSRIHSGDSPVQSQRLHSTKHVIEATVAFEGHSAGW